MTNTSPPVLSIGAILGDSDSENMAWKQAINALSRDVKALRENVTSPLRVNVVFHIDGKLAPNEFAGVRTARYDKRSAHLMVQAAVPPGAGHNRRDVLQELLRRSIDEAERFASQRGVAPQLNEIRALIERLQEP